MSHSGGGTEKAMSDAEKVAVEFYDRLRRDPKDPKLAELAGDSLPPSVPAVVRARVPLSKNPPPASDYSPRERAEWESKKQARLKELDELRASTAG